MMTWQECVALSMNDAVNDEGLKVTKTVASFNGRICTRRTYTRVTSASLRGKLHEGRQLSTDRMTKTETL